MINWKNIPKIYKGGVAIVAFTVFILGYHDQFVTQAEAAERQQQARDEIRYLRVDNLEIKKDALIREKVKAVEFNKIADAEKLEQDIQTLRDKIKGLCDQLDEC